MVCCQDMLPCAMHFVLVRKIRACSSKEAVNKLQSEKKLELIRLGRWLGQHEHIHIQRSEERNVMCDKAKGVGRDKSCRALSAKLTICSFFLREIKTIKNLV